MSKRFVTPEYIDFDYSEDNDFDNDDDEDEPIITVLTTNDCVDLYFELLGVTNNTLFIPKLTSFKLFELSNKEYILPKHVLADFLDEYKDLIHATFKIIQQYMHILLSDWIKFCFLLN